MGPANDYWPADLGGTRRTCPLVHSRAYVGQTRGIEPPAIFPSLCPIFPRDARRIGISIGRARSSVYIEERVEKNRRKEISKRSLKTSNILSFMSIFKVTKIKRVDISFQFNVIVIISYAKRFRRAQGTLLSVLNFFDWIKDTLKLKIIRNGIRKKVPLLQGYFI